MRSFSFTNKNKAQCITEYVVAIAGIVFILLGMQLYAKRAFQARQHASIKYWFDRASSEGIVMKTQYEPYYYTAQEGGKITQVDYTLNQTVSNKRLTTDVDDTVTVTASDEKDFVWGAE